VAATLKRCVRATHLPAIPDSLIVAQFAQELYRRGRWPRRREQAEAAWVQSLEV